MNNVYSVRTEDDWHLLVVASGVTEAKTMAFKEWPTTERLLWTDLRVRLLEKNVPHKVGVYVEAQEWTAEWYCEAEMGRDCKCRACRERKEREARGEYEE